jgi:hypothetical protein
MYICIYQELMLALTNTWHIVMYAFTIRGLIHIFMTYANDQSITKKINDPHVKESNHISDESFEVF